ncbi:2-keto-4-pentenoate hydratase/2-oxohepta-3-ene-1,7-dioic acid hydratase [Burkholderiales bacterium JOSHI_001]|nr:2-keto-4-pentenoate hydratase/2-oxohepta-3-ene-1,7-dioic acid hydratase [Burkholderiales bacterium JOSHI_001]
MSTTAWVRFQHKGSTGFGTLQDGQISVFEGDMFASAVATGRTLALDQVALLTPVVPGKMLALWNNFGQLAAKLGLSAPPEPLYFIKAPNTYLAPGGTIRKPRADVKVVFEGELGIVIGKTASGVSEGDALAHVFGYTCANDVTAVDVLQRDPTFPQWTRAKGYDTFCPLGPVVATGLDPATLSVRTTLNGDLRQDFPISDMRFSVAQLVSLISQDLTLYPGDVILSGTSVGVGSMKPGSRVEVDIAGIGKLANRYE